MNLLIAVSQLHQENGPLLRKQTLKSPPTSDTVVSSLILRPVKLVS